MEYIVIMLLTGALNTACFFIGARVGQTISRGERVTLPKFDFKAAHRDREASRAAEREQERFDTILRNIESYDGTGQGQKDVPRGESEWI